MKIGTALFAYHRNNHTRKVLEALSQNEILPEKLYVFQDGIKESTDYDGWNKVNELLRNIDWCDAEIHISKSNKGVARSIVEGINLVLQEQEAVIVLEDDCVPHKQFMRFMISALNKYQEMKKVYCVSGYAWDIDLPYQDADAYFNGRSCSYGWGTWGDRWNQFEDDYHILTNIIKNPHAYERLQIWGRDLPGMLMANLQNRCDAWDVFWSLKIVEKGGYCLSPYRQMVHNIGFDGSGVHCGKMQENSAVWQEEDKKVFSFPAEIKISRECEEEFRFLFPGRSAEEKLKSYQEILIRWLQMRENNEKIQIPKGCGSKVAVWGKNRVLEALLPELEKQVSVEYIIESRPGEEAYIGHPIIQINLLPQEIKDIFVIPYYDLEIIKAKVKRLRPDICLWGIDELFAWR